MMDETTLTIKADSRPIADQIVVEEPGRLQRSFVRSGEGFIEVTQNKPRVYALKDTDSFISYVQRHGNADQGIIFCETDGLTMFFEEGIRADKVKLPFAPSLELKTFLDPNGSKVFGQKALAKAIETFPDVVEGGRLLLPNIERLKLDTITEFESNIDDRNHVLMYQEKAGKQTAKLPKRLVLTLPFFERSKNLVTIDVEIEIGKPRSENERPLFTLTDPRFERTRQEALYAEVDHIKRALEGWLFVWGNP